MKHTIYTCIYIFKNQCYIILTFVYAFHNYYRVMTACPKIYTKSLKMLIYNENILEKYKVNGNMHESIIVLMYEAVKNFYQLYTSAL